MPALIFSKVRQFNHLQSLQRRRLARSNDPLSAHQHEHHRTALLLVYDMLKQHWSVLCLLRQFRDSFHRWTDFRSRAEVVDALLAALEAYEDALTHQAAEPDEVRYDFEGFEKVLFGAISTLHAAGSQKVLYDKVRLPRVGWQCLEEAEGWMRTRKLLVHAANGKVRMREWEHEEVGIVLDGRFTVSFFDPEEEVEREVALSEALSSELVGAYEGEVDDSGDSSDSSDGQGGEVKLRVRIPQIRNAC